jgi:MFS superfamily sulfate permease-like transporter
MGLITAIVGGLLAGPIAGSKLTIKGPAAGLIVIIAGAVGEFGGGEQGWLLALGAIVAAGLIQILFGVFKMGKLADFFPLSAVHGMLAAIGMIIILKQIPVLLDVDPALAKGKGPFELLLSLPLFLSNIDWRATAIGLLSLAVMLYWQKVPGAFLKKVPASLVVLFLAIPAELLMDFQHTEPPYALVHVGNLIDSVSMHFDFSGFHSYPMVFVKYVVMIALVGSLESLLTVKAIDMMDPYKRRSDTNRDLVAVGFGNLVSGLLGGLPMISEVARSSGNVSNGAKTRWANFYHGFFILLFVIVAVPLIELIPNTALAAMLISVGIKLAHPREFSHIFSIGKEQLAIFLITIFFTLYEDLLVGIAAGILLKIIIHLYNGAPLGSLFKADVMVSSNGDAFLVEIDKSAVFSNFLGLKAKLEAIPAGMDVTLDFSRTRLVDHSVMENVHNFEHDYVSKGGSFRITGLDNHKKLSNHEQAARKNLG